MSKGLLMLAAISVALATVYSVNGDLQQTIRYNTLATLMLVAAIYNKLDEHKP